MTAALLVLLVASMLSAGLELSRERLAGLKRQSRALLKLTALSFTALPLVATGLGAAFALPDDTRTALLLCALCAGGASGPALVSLARGDVGAAGPMTVALAATSAAVATVFFGAGALDVAATLALQLTPLAVGVALAIGAPRAATWLKRPVSLLSSVVLAAVIAGFVWQRGHELFAQPAGYPAAAFMLVATSIAVGFWSAGREAAVTSGVRNLSLALVLATAQVRGPVLVYGLIMYVGVAAWALAMRSRPGLQGRR